MTSTQHAATLGPSEWQREGAAMEPMTIAVNGVELYVERHGSGERLILVHGAWGDGDTWAAVVDPLAERYEVITYDRRGHTRSTGGDHQGGRHEDADDLVALIDALGGEPVHLVGNSAGASIALTVAALRPDRCRTVAAHEPAVTSLLVDHPHREVREALATLLADNERVRLLLDAGEHEAAARLFIDEVALGPGTFDSLPAERTGRWVANASTFLDELNDPDDTTLEVEALAASPVTILLSTGTGSPLVMRAATDEVAARVPAATLVVLDGADHVPHLTHPHAFVEAIIDFHASTSRQAGLV
jgi:pimeloyl-ACP methyl ester carboxylesterase